MDAALRQSRHTPGFGAVPLARLCRYSTRLPSPDTAAPTSVTCVAKSAVTLLRSPVGRSVSTTLRSFSTELTAPRSCLAPLGATGCWRYHQSRWMSPQSNRDCALNDTLWDA